MLACGPIYQAGLGEMVVGGSRWPAGGGWSVVPFFGVVPPAPPFKVLGKAGKARKGCFPVHAV